MDKNVVWLSEVTAKHIKIVGGKNASIGEMIRHLESSNVRVPGGFATTTYAFDKFISSNGLDEKIKSRLSSLDVSNVAELSKAGAEIRQWISDGKFSAELEKSISDSYSKLQENGPVSVAVRSSATAEDLPNASFAGQQETFLNVSGESQVKKRIKEVFASLFNDRAISYRCHQGFDNQKISISAGIQKMVRSDLASSGVMFTLDTESGYRDVVFLTSSYGLGELVVQGAVNPDEFYICKKIMKKGGNPILKRELGSKNLKMIFSDLSGTNSDEVATASVAKSDQQKFSLSDEEVTELASLAVKIENHYGRPMDIEWAKDGVDQNIYIVQARPETVQSQTSNLIERYVLEERGCALVEGRSIGNKIGAGKIRVIEQVSAMDDLQAGEILVTDMTDPDWEPVMKRAAGIVTNRGGRTCHAAIIARELGVPAIVGSVDGTERLNGVEEATVVCSEGDTGVVYEGSLKFSRNEIELKEMPEIETKMMLNVGNPERAFSFAMLPNHGVGLARLEFIINQFIGVHPKALIEFDSLEGEVKNKITKKISAYDGPIDYFVRRLAEGVSMIASAFYPKPVIVRLSDFKSNEYFNLIGGSMYEPKEENPMLGFRGASRYVSDSFRPCFDLECKAIRLVREEMGLDNVEVMVPFVRTLDEAKESTELLAENGLERGTNNLRVVMMCELPSNAVLASQFLEFFDGFSIGSNDMTQLTLGLDRDSGLVSHLFDERDPAVMELLKIAIRECRKRNKYVGICGQGPSDHPDFAKWLLEEGIESLSLNPDTVIESWLSISNKAI